MSDQTTDIEQQQNEAAFSAGFNSVRPSDGYEPPDGEDAHVEVSEFDNSADDEQEPEAIAGTGLTAGQIKELLARTSRFEEQLGKAHGKIGEMNRTVQELRQQRTAETGHIPEIAGDANDDDWSEVDDLFPGFAQKVADKARRAAIEAMQASGWTQQQVDHNEVMRNMAVSVMDATHPGWRETVQSDDFSLWIATQPDEVRESFNSTWDVGEFSAIIRGFSESRKPAQARNRQRLESAITPDARAGTVHRGMTNEQAFKYGFESVRNARRY
jgi:hypothetical protein